MKGVRTEVLILAEARADAVTLVRRDLPAPGPDEALVRIDHAGICGTDLHILDWNDWAARSYRPPFALGHELGGVVVTGGGGFRPGDRVTAETHLACGACAQCRAGRGHTCEHLRTFSRLDRGAFARHAVIPVALLRPIPAGVPDRIGAVMEPVGIGLRAATEAEVAGRVVLVSGCGPVGLVAVAAARFYGAARVLAVDPVAERRALAVALGAERAIDPAAEPVGQALADVTIETSGNARAFGAALAATRTGGTVIVAGLPGAPVPVDIAGQVVLREVQVRGIYGRWLDRTWAQMAEAFAGGLALEPLITHAYPLEEFRAAFAMARSGRCGKVIFDLRGRD